VRVQFQTKQIPLRVKEPLMRRWVGFCTVYPATGLLSVLKEIFTGFALRQPSPE